MNNNWAFETVNPICKHRSRQIVKIDFRRNQLCSSQIYQIKKLSITLFAIVSEIKCQKSIMVSFFFVFVSVFFFTQNLSTEFITVHWGIFFIIFSHGIQDNLEWKRTMKSLPFSIFKDIGLNFLSPQYGIAIAICANFQTPNFKRSACAGLQAFDLKCPLEAFGGQIQHFYRIQKRFYPKKLCTRWCQICKNDLI